MALRAPVKTYAREVSPGQVDFYFEGSKVSINDFYNNLMNKYGYSLDNIDNMLPAGYAPVSDPYTGELKLITQTVYQGTPQKLATNKYTNTATRPSSVTQPEYVSMFVNGQMQQYNLADPNDRVRFYDDKLSLLTQMKEEALAKSGGVFDQNMADIQQEIIDTQKAAKDYIASYEKGVAEFGENYGLGNVKRGQFFAGISPNAFQSSQGTSALYGQNKYIEGLGEMARGAQKAVGEGFMANPSNFGAIGEGSTFGRTIGGLGREKANLQSGFQDYVRSLNQNIAEQAASTGTDLSKANAFDFSRTRTGVPQVEQTDLSAYTPFTQFTGQAAKTNVMPKIYTGNAFSETGLDAFLGRTKLNKPQSDLLRNYLLARG